MNIQPNSLETEENIIASVLVNNENWKYIDQLKEIDFYYPTTRKIFKLMKELHENNNPIDIVSVKEKGVSKKYDGIKLMKILVEMTEKMGLSSQIEYYIRILKNLSIKRQIYQKASEVCKEILEIENDKDELEIKNEIIQKFIDIKVQEKEKNGEMTNVMLETLEDIEKKYQKRDDYTYRTGFFDVDKVTDGLHEQELTIIAARPGVGKTAFALQMAENISKKNICVYFVSLEMSEKQLGNRIIAREAEIDGHKLRMGWLEEEDFEKIGEVASKISNLKMYIDSKSATIQDIEMKATELKQENKLGLIIIDYLQLLKSRNRFNVREQEVAEISRKLKLMSKNLNIPVVALCQLNRETEKRKRPMLSDLRESGSLEQDADNVIFLYVDEDEKTQVCQNIEVIIAKQRNGPTGTVKMAFNKKQMRFINLVRRNKQMKYIEIKDFKKLTNAQKANYCKRIVAGELKIKEVKTKK
jgi:replicative DNA helicase